MIRWLLLAVLLTGCAAARLYDHKADMSNYAQDHYQCVQEARTGGRGSGLPAVAAIQTMKKTPPRAVQVVHGGAWLHGDHDERAGRDRG
jgi:hypothetical protein